jgi:hypothetical protein
MDAVEIDPVILRLGAERHPDRRIRIRASPSLATMRGIS